MLAKAVPDKNAARKRSYLWGIAAEYLCALSLLLKGYGILKLRYRNHRGEIDIIAIRHNLLVFIEVKARESRETALQSVTPAKQHVLAKAAESFIATQTKYHYHDLRFDVMVVTSFMKIYHYKDAWRIE